MKTPLIKRIDSVIATMDKTGKEYFAPLTVGKETFKTIAEHLYLIDEITADKLYRVKSDRAKSITYKGHKIYLYRGRV